MDSDDDMDFEVEDDEMLEHETCTLAKLRGKELAVQNADGTLRCPLSPSRKKQAYAYKDLLQHATAVASGKRGPEAAGKHSALKKFLEADLSSLSVPPPERMLKVDKILPRTKQAEEMFVWPWCVVVYNIDNSRRDTAKPETRVGLGRSELREYFKDYNLSNVDVLWNRQGHQGMCVVLFSRDLSSLKDAKELENSFRLKHHGLRDYERGLASGDLDKGFYGWQASEDDFKGRRFGYNGQEMAKTLKKHGELKTMGMVADEVQRMHAQQVRQLAATVSEKNQESQDLRIEMESVRRTAEANLRELEESHKLELEGLRTKARISEDKFNQSTLESRRALAEKEAELCQLDKELRERESDLKSTEEKDKLQAQLVENQLLRDQIANQEVIVQQTLSARVQLEQKHQEETRQLAERAQKDKVTLKMRQNREIEREQLHSIIATEKLFDKLTISPDGKSEGSTKVAELEDRMKELKEELGENAELINSLVVKERKSNDELVEAGKKAISVLQHMAKAKYTPIIEPALEHKQELDKRKKVQDRPPPPPRVALRSAGAIDDTSWASVFKKKYKGGEEVWGVEMKLVLSIWDDLIKTQEFCPYKTVNIGNDKWKKEIDDKDEKLVALKKNFGEEVYNSVTTALMEIEEYNASGRYPIHIPWIPQKSRKASMEEVIAHFGEVIAALLLLVPVPPPPTASRKKPRN